MKHGMLDEEISAEETFDPQSIDDSDENLEELEEAVEELEF